MPNIWKVTTFLTLFSCCDDVSNLTSCGQKTSFVPATTITALPSFALYYWIPLQQIWQAGNKHSGLILFEIQGCYWWAVPVLRIQILYTQTQYCILRKALHFWENISISIKSYSVKHLQMNSSWQVRKWKKKKKAKVLLLVQVLRWIQIEIKCLVCSSAQGNMFIFFEDTLVKYSLYYKSCGFSSAGGKYTDRDKACLFCF